MIIRHHRANGTSSRAAFSDCETYRYSLTRVWDKEGPRVMFVMLNPSTADETRNDPTVERCERRARALDYGAFRVCNIFAYRATDPRDLRRAAAPEGPGNAAALRRGARWADHIVAAWGAHGDHLDQGRRIAALLAGMRRPLFHLGLTKAGHPRHPLYLRYGQEPVLWVPFATAKAGA
ncbi:MAG: DUF1643 domain-containing protein [Pseudomonadota bacterium]